MSKITNKLYDDLNLSKNYKLVRKLQVFLNLTLKNDYEDYSLELADRIINLRTFNKTKKNKKVIIYFHGGGWVSGSIPSYTSFLSSLAKKLKVMIISVDYRLAPEYKFPKGFDDCFEATELIIEGLKEKIKMKNIILMGDSAGGNIACAVSQKGRDTNKFRIKKQVLIYPSLCGYHKDDNDSDYLIKSKDLKIFINYYLANEKDISNPYFAPILSNKLLFAPKTLIITADNDILKEDGIMYYNKLRRYLNKPVYLNIKDSYHGFLNNPLESKNTDKTIGEIKKFI